VSMTSMMSKSIEMAALTSATALNWCPNNTIAATAYPPATARIKTRHKNTRTSADATRNLVRMHTKTEGRFGDMCRLFVDSY